MKYIFLAGAPGSRWSSVAKYLYSSPQLDTSDSDKSYTMPGTSEPMHLGAYWDPGMEYGENFDVLDIMSIAHVEEEFNAPFSGTGTRLIKSHQFCKYLDILAKDWKCPIVLVHRDARASYDWWVKAGGFDITYPNYNWYKNRMMDEILLQNTGVEKFVHKHGLEVVRDTVDLAYHLGIDIPAKFNFAQADTKVFVYKSL